MRNLAFLLEYVVQVLVGDENPHQYDLLEKKKNIMKFGIFGKRLKEFQK